VNKILGVKTINRLGHRGIVKKKKGGGPQDRAGKKGGGRNFDYM